MSTTITARYSELPIERDIRIQSGRSWEERWTVSLDEEGAGAVPINFSQATVYQARFQDADGVVLAFDLAEAAAGGAVTMRLAATDTEALAAGQQDWEMVFVFPVGSTDFPDGATFSLFAGVAQVINRIEE